MQPHSDTCPVAFILATPLSEALRRERGHNMGKPRRSGAFL